jgi:hypothetical protein
MMRLRSDTQSRSAIVIPEQAPQSLAAANGARLPRSFGPGFKDSVVQSLMGAFAVIMAQELVHRLAKRMFAEKDHAVQGFLLERSEESLQMGIGLNRQLHPI